MATQTPHKIIMKEIKLTVNQNMYRSQEVYFSSEEGARSAIKEVVEPFVKEHPDFV